MNDYLRVRWNARREMKPVKPFRVRARNLGLRPGLNYDCISELLEQLEGPFDR